MIATKAFYAVLIFCPATRIVNPSGDWNDQDQKALTAAQNTCKIAYNDSPCLKTFKKVEEGVYTAICGAPK
jgi:hypothetical protein